MRQTRIGRSDPQCSDARVARVRARVPLSPSVAVRRLSRVFGARRSAHCTAAHAPASFKKQPNSRTSHASRPTSSQATCAALARVR
jgi:hypothetical protein